MCCTALHHIAYAFQLFQLNILSIRGTEAFLSELTFSLFPLVASDHLFILVQGHSKNVSLF